jgi:hypothetical protein
MRFQGELLENQTARRADREDTARDMASSNVNG